METGGEAAGARSRGLADLPFVSLIVYDCLDATKLGNFLKRGIALVADSQASSASRRFSFTALAVVAALFMSCEVVSVSGPNSGRVGDILSYEIQIEQTDSQSATNVQSWLVIEIPESWSLVDASFTAVVGGTSVGGKPQFPVTAPAGDGCWSNTDPPPGAQRIGLTTAAFAQADPGDQGTVVVDLLVAGTPGDFTLRFDLVSQTQIVGCTSFFRPAEHQVIISPLSLAEVPALSLWGAATLAALLAGLGLRRLWSAA